MFNFLRRRSAERRSRVELSQLDAYLLRDIGLNPSDFRDPLDDHRAPMPFALRRRPDR
jgi:hypothetical protein